MIKARTDAAGPLGIEEAIRRLNMYAEAGADCLFADALLSAKDIERVARNVPPLTLSVNMGLGIRSRGTTPLLSPKQLEEMGVAQVSYPRLLTTSALKGMLNAMKVFKDEVVDGHKVVDRPDLLASFDELNELMGFDDARRAGGAFRVMTVAHAASFRGERAVRREHRRCSGGSAWAVVCGLALMPLCIGAALGAALPGKTDPADRRVARRWRGRHRRANRDSAACRNAWAARCGGEPARRRRQYRRRRGCESAA